MPPWPTLTLLTLAILLWLFAGPAPEALVYDRAGLGRGEWWRWFTGHLVHSDGEHALWDIAALAIIGVMVERQGRARLVGATLAGLVAVNACLWWCLPELARYCGLSGVLNSLFVVALADSWRRQRHPLIPLVAVGLALKLAIELATRQSLVLDMAWASLPEAHVAGCLGGLVYLWLADLDIYRRPRSWHKRLSGCRKADKVARH